jgi:hypothetical protein
MRCVYDTGAVWGWLWTQMDTDLSASGIKSSRSSAVLLYDVPPAALQTFAACSPVACWLRLDVQA